ncbi:MAG TPA: WbqC family protein, partial [Vicinamibacteria bacterium]
IEPVYAREWSRIAELNTALVRTVAAFLSLAPEFRPASEFGLGSTGDSRLIDLTHAVGGSTYISGAGGQNYQDPAKFASAGLQLEVRRYEPVPYPQGAPGFLPGLSILDALFRLGTAAREVLVYADAATA